MASGSQTLNDFLLGFANAQADPVTGEGSQEPQQPEEQAEAQQGEQEEETEGAVGGDPLAVGANQEIEDDDEDDDEEYEEDNDYDPEEDEYLNKFINKDSLVSKRVTTKRVSLTNRLGICFDHIFFPRFYARRRDHRGLVQAREIMLR